MVCLRSFGSGMSTHCAHDVVVTLIQRHYNVVCTVGIYLYMYVLYETRFIDALLF